MEDIDALARKRFQLLRTNEYGRPDYSKWGREWDKYWRYTLLWKVKERGLSIDSTAWHDLNTFPEHPKRPLTSAVKQMLESRTALIRREAERITSITPLEFEIAVADRLMELGWDAYTTKGSGDQGADVVATRGKLMLIVQCKYLSKAVGNKAVQEVSAARSHYLAQQAAVVTNTSFTRAAHELANTNSIHLLHYSELGEVFGGYHAALPAAAQV